MQLSIVIPSRDPAPEVLGRIAALVRDHAEWQVILVDDGSDRALAAALDPAPNLTVLRNETARGAGFSRNRGLGRVRGDHIVFLDDDDVMDWAVVAEVIDWMDAQPAVDMAVSSYEICRDGARQPASSRDTAILKAILEDRSHRSVSLDGHEILLQMTNYPWTKVYRAEFVARIGLRFSETFVQNDIHAHWQSLLAADRILVTGRVQCLKHETSGTGRISGTADARRLEAFVALRETCDLVCRQGQPRVEVAFWAFYFDLVRWMIDVSNAATRPLLVRDHIAFVAGLPPDAMRRMETGDGNAPWDLCDPIGPPAAPDTDRLRRDLAHRTAEVEALRRALRQAREDIHRTDLRDRRLRADHATALETLAGVRADNDRMTTGTHRMRDEMSEMERDLNSRSARWAFRLRSVFRAIVR